MWIRIGPEFIDFVDLDPSRIELKCWIRIEVNPDPQPRLQLNR
jgi:hypothetical protein